MKEKKERRVRRERKRGRIIFKKGYIMLNIYQYKSDKQIEIVRQTKTRETCKERTRRRKRSFSSPESTLVWQERLLC